jgi:hypothetical protein
MIVMRIRTMIMMIMMTIMTMIIMMGMTMTTIMIMMCNDDKMMIVIVRTIKTMMNGWSLDKDDNVTDGKDDDYAMTNRL